MTVKDNWADGDHVTAAALNAASAAINANAEALTYKQPIDTELTALSTLTSAANKGIQFTGSGTAATYDLTAAGKALLDDADAAAQRVTLGIVDAAGAVVAPYAQITGGQSATTGLRFVGSVATEGWPTTGTWVANDVVQDKYGALFRCIAGGTPGTWSNMSAGFQDQVPNEFQYSATYVTGGPIALSATPTTLPVADGSRFPIPAGSVATPIVIGTGVAEGVAENRILATYTGVSGNTLTGVVTQDGSSKSATTGLQVWYAKSGLRSSYLRIPNGIIARSGIDQRPHDLVLLAAYDDSGRGNRADFDIILGREAGSYGVLHIDLPVRFPRDTVFMDGSGSALMTFAGSVEADTNKMTVSPLPTGSIYVHGRLEGRLGASANLVLKNSGVVNSRIELQNSAGTRMFSTDETGAELPNVTELRFRRSDSGYGSITMSAGNTMVFRSPGTNGIAFNNNANNAARFAVSDVGVVTILGTIELGHATDTTLSRSAAGVLAVEGVAVPTISSTSTLTNKSVDLASNTLTGTTAQFNTALTDNDFATLAGTETLTNKTVTVREDQFTLQDSADATKQARFNIPSGQATATTRTYTLPGQDRTLASLEGTETLLLKTLTSPKITSGNAPATAASTGTVGQIEWANGFLYLCVATNTWQRAALATW